MRKELAPLFWDRVYRPPCWDPVMQDTVGVIRSKTTRPGDEGLPGVVSNGILGARETWITSGDRRHVARQAKRFRASWV